MIQDAADSDLSDTVVELINSAESSSAAAQFTGFTGTATLTVTYEPTISLVSLAPGVIEAGLSYPATLVVHSTSSVTVQAITVAVRDSSNDNLDFPSARSATLNGVYVFTSGAKSFAAGTYTEFGSYEIGNVWYPFASQTLTVTAAPSSSSPNPPPVGIPGTWTSTLNDGPTYTSGGAADNVSNLLNWGGASGTYLQQPHNSDEDACYAPGNVAQAGDFVDLSLTKPATSDCSPPAGYDPEPDYGAQVYSGQVSSGSAFTQTYGAFEAEVYLPPDAAGLIADWPAWWMVGDSNDWPTDGEIDLMEGLGGIAEYHFPYGQTSPGYGPGGSVPSIGPGWHTFGVDWQPALDASYPSTS